jgi:hypothetical protein
LWKPLGRLRYKIDKIDLVEIGWGGVDYIGLAQDRGYWRDFVDRVMKFRVSKRWKTIEWLYNLWALE